ncbi:MAG: GGDEF domain-containing phosphodiesterase [Coriobacteriales bacterium]|nr:GGDEF domain-containing phosphodiesterase [Coriobacteriales bacterium]
MTGLYREDFFYRRVDNLLFAYPDRSYDMVCSDIRDFKTLNECYGRKSCDRLLHDLAQKLVDAIPDVVSCGRIGGDSFGFLIEHQHTDWTAILDPLVRGMEVAHLFVRFGIVENVDHSLLASLICDRAILAIDELRDSVGAGVLRYDDELHARKTMEGLLVESMQEGIEQHQFLVCFQPKHDVVTGEVAGAEALVRWEHPELGFVRPDAFITLFERNGLISALDRYVCREACRQIARIRDKGLMAVPISINISPLDFDDHELPSHIKAIADEYGVDHELLHVELTETAYAEDPDVVVHALEELRAYGFKVELDDFGSGYSSLALLNRLPLDVLKIDGGMVQDASRLNDYRIVWSAIQIAQLLGLKTVAEGVETSEEVQRLKEMGCDFIQGFYYARPLQRDEFERYLQANRP